MLYKYFIYLYYDDDDRSCKASVVLFFIYLYCLCYINKIDVFDLLLINKNERSFRAIFFCLWIPSEVRGFFFKTFKLS